MNLPRNTDSEDRLTALLSAVWPEIESYTHRRLPTEAEVAEELLQEAAADLFQLWEERGEVPRERAVAILKQSVKRDIADHRRKQGRRRTSPVAADDEVLLDHLDQNRDPEHEILALLSDIDDKRHVRALLGTLEEGQRAAIVAVYIDGATQQQASAELGIGVRALQVRLRKALTALRRHAASLRGDAAGPAPQSGSSAHQAWEIPR
ncbi:RNA polymerase sigma factor [Lentzea sp. NPDC059081]|uniref:RNA polymerase sigma factor n=1 Tax=Lentzea sp. NPDC059081 TaxID=3346719 RepID=UPI00367A9E17